MDSAASDSVLRMVVDDLSAFDLFLRSDGNDLIGTLYVTET